MVARTPDFAEGWNRRATVRFMIGDLNGSVDDIRRTLSLEPRHFGALSGLGLIYLQREDWGGARQAFDEALAINPHLPGPRQNLEMIEQRAREETI